MMRNWNTGFILYQRPTPLCEWNIGQLHYLSHFIAYKFTKLVLLYVTGLYYSVRYIRRRYTQTDLYEPDRRYREYGTQSLIPADCVPRPILVYACLALIETIS